MIIHSKYCHVRVSCFVSYSESCVIGNCFTSPTPKQLGRTHARTDMHIKPVRESRNQNCFLSGLSLNAIDVLTADEASCTMFLETVKRWHYKSLFTCEPIWRCRRRHGPVRGQFINSLFACKRGQSKRTVSVCGEKITSKKRRCFWCNELSIHGVMLLYDDAMCTAASQPRDAEGSIPKPRPKRVRRSRNHVFGRYFFAACVGC
jgi:hypothetical protein